jgi:hypothetical protein
MACAWWRITIESFLGLWQPENSGIRCIVDADIRVYHILFPFPWTMMDIFTDRMDHLSSSTPDADAPPSLMLPSSFYLAHASMAQVRSNQRIECGQCSPVIVDMVDDCSGITPKYAR